MHGRAKRCVVSLTRCGHGCLSRRFGANQRRCNCSTTVRVGKRAAVQASRYAHAKQYQRMRRQLHKLRTYVGRLTRDIRRQTTGIDDGLAALLDRADRIRCQQPKEAKKLYSLHEPEVQCISKGKAHKCYEFGQKVAVATTNRSNWFVAAHLLENNPYDGHTLNETLMAAERVTGVSISDAYVDKGYRGHGYTGGAELHIAGQHKKNTTRAERKRRRRRSAIEPKIGHLKSDHRMGRCFLSRLCGDAINAVLAGAWSNLRKLLGLLRRKAGRFVYALTSLAAVIEASLRKPRNRPCFTLFHWAPSLLVRLKVGPDSSEKLFTRMAYRFRESNIRPSS